MTDEAESHPGDGGRPMTDELREALAVWLASAGDDEGTEARLIAVAREWLYAQPTGAELLWAAREAGSGWCGRPKPHEGHEHHLDGLPWTCLGVPYRRRG